MLTVDVSNAGTSLALWVGDKAAHHWRVASDPLRPADELLALLKALFSLDSVDPGAFAGAALASVVPELTGPVESVLTRLTGQAPVVIGPGVRTGVDVRTEHPREVGPDRIANAASAYARVGGPVLVLDFSTTLTVDVVGPDGAYLGAAIAPGLDVAAEALARRTARLPRVDLVFPDRAIGGDTQSGLQSGLVLGYRGLIDGLVRRMQSVVGPAHVLATGEAPWAARLAAECETIQQYESLLTLDGIRRIYERSVVEREPRTRR